MAEIPTFEGYTVAEAKAYLRMGWHEGVGCPCCNQFVKLYVRKFNVNMAHLLITLNHIPDDGRWTHFRDLSPLGTDYPFVRFWGLAETQPAGVNGKGRTSGMWRMTREGRCFVAGSVEVPKYVHIYNSKRWGESDETIGVRAALGERFDYDELMRRRPGSE